MNKLLALVTLAVCVVIASTSHLDARSETPPRSHGDHHYQLQQHHNHHNHKSQSAAAVAAIAAAAHGRSAALDAVDSSRTAAGGAAVIPSTDERPLRLRRWNYDGNTQHRRSYHRTGRNFETRRGIGSGAPEVPSNPGWQLDWTGKNIATRRSGGSGGGVPSVFSSKPIWETRYNSTRSLSDSGLGYAGSAPTTDGKEGIMRDVEHISGDTLNNEWMHRMEPELVTLPPTTTTTTSTTTTTTERPYGTGFGGRKGGGFDGRTDSKGLDSRHICMQQRTLQVPVKSVEVYQRPIWKHISHPCPTQTNQSNQMCTRVQLAHEPVYRDVIRHKTTKQMVLECCSGWTRVTKSANGCMKPVCSSTCRNGGTCIGPDTCSCPQGYGGKYCEKDINECKEEKPCDQLCFNTEGSFYCQCREGFVLQADKQSCKKIDNHDDDAFEARDLENEVDSNEVTLRLHKIEKSLANERVTTNELQKSLQATYTVVDSLKNRLTTLEKQQQDMNHLQTNLMATETRTRKLENMISILLKCRNSPGPYCS